MKKIKKENFEFTSIGYIESCFKQKFGIPRQPGLVKLAKAKLILFPEFSQSEAVRGLDQYSHLWVLFVFHQSKTNKHKMTVRPPRLGGKEKYGVFATRSNYRPNPIGQSVVKLESVAIQQGHIELILSGVDILDQSPVIDIKPYLPYADNIPNAHAGIAHQAPEKIFNVVFSNDATAQIQKATLRHNIDMMTFISDLLAYDPRPAFYSQSESTEYASRILDFDLIWKIEGERVTVLCLEESSSFMS